MIKTKKSVLVCMIFLISLLAGFMVSGQGLGIQKGTCISLDAGDCQEGVRQADCREVGGKWYAEPAEEIEDCRLGCCFLGDGVIYTSKIDCDYQYSINDLSNPTTREKFRNDLTQEECYYTGGIQDEGACIYESGVKSLCKRTTREDCSTNLDGDFYDGKLCTSDESGIAIAECSPTKKVECYDYKAYFVDSCGQRGNIYDKDKETNEDYWEEIQNPDCVVDLDKGEFDSDCGYCDQESICSDYEGQNPSMPDNVCVSVNCNDDEFYERYGRHPKNGESWCSGTNSTFVPIERDPDQRGILVNSDSSKFSYVKNEMEIDNLRSELEDANKYNLPGSMYWIRSCNNGEVTTIECDPHRESICTESWNDIEELEYGYRDAVCEQNTWQGCFNIDNKEDCESSIMCKWLYGYRYYPQDIVTSPGDRNESYQGICLPMFAPGFDWNSSTGGGEMCGTVGDVLDVVLYQSGIFRNRDGFYEKQKDGDDKWPFTQTTKLCLENCHLIPFYGNYFVEEGGIDLYENIDTSSQIFDFWRGGKLGDNVGSNKYLISKQKGYYCHKPGEENKSKLGSIAGKDADCLSSSKDKAENMPVFLTHDEYLYYLQQRARSIGDCGYKSHAFSGYEGDRGLEILESNAQKVGQDRQIKEDKKEKNNLGKHVVYKGFDSAGYQAETYKNIPEGGSISV